MKISTYRNKILKDKSHTSRENIKFSETYVRNY